MEPLPTEHAIKTVIKLYARRLGLLLAVLAVTVALVGVGLLIALYPQATLITLAALGIVVILVWGGIYSFAGITRLRTSVSSGFTDLLIQLAVLATGFGVARGKEVVQDLEVPEGTKTRPDEAQQADTKYRVEIANTALESLETLSADELANIYTTIERLQHFGPQILAQPFIGRVGEGLYRATAGRSHEIIFSFNEANRSIVIPIVRKVDRRKPNNDPD